MPSAIVSERSVDTGFPVRQLRAMDGAPLAHTPMMRVFGARINVRHEEVRAAPLETPQRVRRLDLHDDVAAQSGTELRVGVLRCVQEDRIYRSSAASMRPRFRSRSM
jgi:hypothetical protein